MVYHIYLFRHGQTFYNKNKIFTGWKDSKLTPLGVKQARALGKKLKDKEIEIFFQTDLSRSKDTLKEVLKFHKEAKEIITANGMIERSYGDLAGLKHSTIAEKYGKKKFDEWHRGYDVRPPKGESFAMVEKRVSKFIKELIEFIVKEKVNVGISAHGNSIRIFRKIWEKESKKNAVGWNIPYDKVFHYGIEVEGKKINRRVFRTI